VSRSRICAAIPVALVALALSACSVSRAASSAHPTASGPAPLPVATKTPKAKPSPSRTVTATPSPTKTVVIQPARTNVATGKGPAGSIRVTGNSTVALTFDDGPDPTYTPMILNLLRKYRIKATFCVVGFRARDHPDLIKKIAAGGHTICNHSWQHLFDLGTHSDAEILRDLRATNNAITKAVPGIKIKYFRAPGGNFNTRLVKLAASLGMKSIYWAVDTRDWEYSTYGHGSSMVSHIIWAVKYYTQPGSIVLSHDLGKPDTVTAYATLLPWLKARYKLVALPT
jgi:peptidoglycan-N-acetylglucosamine deacetylase